MRRTRSGRRSWWLALLATTLLLTGGATAADDGWLPLRFAAALTSPGGPGAAPATEPPVLIVTGVPSEPGAWLPAGGAFGELSAQPPAPQLLGDTARADLAPTRGKVHRKLTAIEQQLQTVATTGAVALPAPVAGQRVLALLLSPVLNSGEYWGPTGVCRQGASFTVLIESWTDNEPRDRNHRERQLYALDLGEWPAGDYQVQLTRSSWFRDEAQKLPATLYQPRDGLAGATLAVAVRAAPAEGQAAPAPALAAAAVLDLPIEETLVPPAFGQLPRFSRPDSGWAKAAGPGIFAGDVDAAGALVGLDLPVGNAAAMPQRAGRGNPAAVIVGPELNLYEGLTLAAVEWGAAEARDHNSVVVRVRLWRDTGPRRKNIPFTPVLVVPLSPPGGTAKPLALRVDWTVLVAPAPGGSCAPDAAATAKLQQGTRQRAIWTPAE